MRRVAGSGGPRVRGPPAKLIHRESWQGTSLKSRPDRGADCRLPLLTAVAQVRIRETLRPSEHVRRLVAAVDGLRAALRLGPRTNVPVSQGDSQPAPLTGSYPIEG